MFVFILHQLKIKTTSCLSETNIGLIFHKLDFLFSISPVKLIISLKKKTHFPIDIFCTDGQNLANGCFVDYCKNRGILEINVIKVLWGKGKACCLISEKLLSFSTLFLVMLNM